MEQGYERRFIRFVLKVAVFFGGMLALALGAVGTVMPLVPTTPLVLLAAICFSYSNKRLETWLRKSRLFGDFIENYYTKKGISRKKKVGSICFLWVGLVTSMVVLRVWWVYGLLLLVGSGVTVHILMIKTRGE
jgi:hypothetical protein